MTRRFAPFMLLALALPAAGQSPNLAPRHVTTVTGAVAADTNFTAAMAPTVSSPAASKFSATIAITSTAASIMLEIDPDGSGATSPYTPYNLRDDGADLSTGRQYTVSWDGIPGQTYKLQMSEATTITQCTVTEMRGAIAVAGRVGGSGGATTTGTSLTGLGTDDRLARWNGTDTLQSSSVQLLDSGALSWATGLGAITHVTFPTDQNGVVRGGAQSTADGDGKKLIFHGGAAGSNSGNGGDINLRGGSSDNGSHGDVCIQIPVGTNIVKFESDDSSSVFSGVIKAPDGSIAAPSRSYTNDTDLGWARFGTDMEISTSGAGKCLEIRGCTVTLTDATATSIVTIPLAAGARVGGIIHYTVEAQNGTDVQARTGSAYFAAVDKTGTLTTDVDIVGASTSIAVSASSLPNPTFTFVDGTNSITIQANTDCTMSTPTIVMRFTVQIWHSSAVTPTVP